MYKVHTVPWESCVMIPRLNDTSYEVQVDRWLRSTRLGNSKHPCMLDFPRITWYLFSSLMRIQKFKISFNHL